MSDTWSMPTGSRDRWPEDYDRGRPGWPPAVVELPGVPAEATVVDLGAGTGKLTRLLVERFRRVIAVEPAAEMRALLAKRLSRVSVLGGTAHDIALAEASVDAVFVAQAFHWFDDERALVEIARVLNCGGSLVVMWNEPAGPFEPTVAAAESLLNEHVPEGFSGYDPLDLGSARYASGDWRAAFAGQPFEPLQDALIPNLQTLDREGLVAFYASMGWFADLPDADRLPLLDRVRSLLEHDEYRRLWQTHLHWTSLTR
jgi:SAM-dependent methyltransferase